jgi:type VI secretion system protein ImpE
VFSGDWERAERQLEVVGHQDTNAMIGSMIYRQNFKAERDRANLFANGLKPEFLLTPPAYVEDLLQANNRLREGNAGEARQILDDVEENRPAFACRVNDEQFTRFPRLQRRNDVRSGSVFERSIRLAAARTDSESRVFKAEIAARSFLDSAESRIE